MKKHFLIAAIITVTLFFTCMYFIYPAVEYSPLENRNMAMFSTIKNTSFTTGTFQTNLEEALKDQIFLRNDLIRYYSNIKGESRKYFNAAMKFFDNAGAFIKNLFVSDNGSPLPSGTTSLPTVSGTTSSEASGTQTTAIPSTSAISTTVDTSEFWLEPSGNVYKINGTDQLTYYPFLDNYPKKSNYKIFATQISLLATRHPDVKVYAYYIMKTEDLNWFDKSENIRTFDYASFLFSYLSADIRYDKFELDSMQEVRDFLYRTDHHWNHVGAYRGYTEIMSMLMADFKLPVLRNPVKELDFISSSRPGGVLWYGSKYKASGGAKVSEPDSFKAYDYGLAGRYTAYYGSMQKDIGLAEQYAAGNINSSLLFDHYVEYYGYAGDLIKYTYPENEGGYNMLVIGDSNNRPIRKVLGSHFNNFYFIEKRILDRYDVDKFITDNAIDAVLFLGESDFWEMYRLPGYPEQ